MSARQPEGTQRQPEQEAEHADVQSADGKKMHRAGLAEGIGKRFCSVLARSERDAGDDSADAFVVFQSEPERAHDPFA